MDESTEIMTTYTPGKVTLGTVIPVPAQGVTRSAAATFSLDDDDETILRVVHSFRDFVANHTPAAE
jgi:hypothetical protein